MTRFGAQAFNKSTDDLIIRYSQDLLPAPTVWCTAKSRKRARHVQKQQDEFNEKQAALLKAGVTKTDADILAKDSQMQKFVQQCRASHNGPLNSPDEVDDLVNRADLKDDDKALRSALTKEVRYRKYSSLSIKFDNPLSHQRKCDTLTLINNLKLLLMKCDSSLAAKATMSDLEAVIAKPDCAENSEEVTTTSSENLSTVRQSAFMSTAYEEPLSNISDWPLAKGTHIATNFSDGFYVGEVLSVLDDDTV